MYFRQREVTACRLPSIFPFWSWLKIQRETLLQQPLYSHPFLSSNHQLAGNKFYLMKVTPRLVYYQCLILFNSSIRSIQNILERWRSIVYPCSTVGKTKSHRNGIIFPVDSWQGRSQFSHQGIGSDLCLQVKRVYKVTMKCSLPFSNETLCIISKGVSWRN